jgi:hypothetical protein
LPCAVIFPKVIFRKITAFLIFCSAGYSNIRISGRIQVHQLFC